MLHLFDILSAMLSQIFNLNCIFWKFTPSVFLNPALFNLGHVFVSIDDFYWPFEVSYQRNILKLNLWYWKLVLTIKLLPRKRFAIHNLNFWILKRFIKVWLCFCQVVFRFEVDGANRADRSFRKVEVKVKSLFFQWSIIRLKLFLHSLVFSNIILYNFYSLD